MPQDTPPLLVLVRNCHGTALDIPWVSLGSGVFPSCRQGAAEPPQCLHPACQKSRERVRSTPRAATIPGLPTEGASKRAKLSKSCCGIQRWIHGLQAHVLMHKQLSSALDGFHQPVGCSMGLLPPCILPQGFAGFHLPYWETKAKRNPTAFLLFLSAGTACECRGTHSSGNMELESFQLPNSTRASAVGFVLLIHPQGYFWIPPPGRTGFVLFSVFLGEQLAEE